MASKTSTSSRSNARTSKRGVSRSSAGKSTRAGSRTMTTRRREKIPGSEFAFPKERKEPLTDARHVKNALARFDQVEGVSDSERRAAFKRIKQAASRYGIDVQEKDWRELGKRPHTMNPVHKKKTR